MSVKRITDTREKFNYISYIVVKVPVVKQKQKNQLRILVLKDRIRPVLDSKIVERTLSVTFVHIANKIKISVKKI